MNDFYRGEAVSMTVTVTADGTAVNILTGSYEVATMEYTLRRGQLEEVGVPVITKTIGAGIVVSAQSGETLGQAVIALDTADTKVLEPGLYWDQVAVTFTSAPGQVKYVVLPQRRVVYGAVKVPA